MSAHGQFEAAALHELGRANENEYTNARYAPVGNEIVGKPFPAFREYAGRFTDYTPAGQTASNWKRQANLPTDNTLFRNTIESNAVNLGNSQNTAWTYRTQTLANNGDTIACRNDTDCQSWPGTTCNGQYQNWTDAKGNQGNYCAYTVYPEVQSGTYNRKDTNQGGVGRACSTDGDCGTGYFCNNETNMFGTNVQQTGYCSIPYQCPDGSSHFLGYGYNSALPITPDPKQNNNGQGFSNQTDCMAQPGLGQEKCVQDSSGMWFATYPGLCPVPASMRSGASPTGQLAYSSEAALAGGIKVPAYATNKSSSITKPLQAFSAWNINSEASHLNNMHAPMAYELAINPR